MIRLTLFLGMLIALAACDAAIITDAPAFTEYTAEQQAQMSAAFKALPGDSPLRRALKDCRALRDEIRAAGRGEQ